MNGFAIARYLSNGDLDTTFGEGGKVIIELELFTYDVSVRVRSNNSIIVCGNSGGKNIVIAHIRSNGDIDFDPSGSEAKYNGSFMNDQERPIIRKVMFAKSDQLVTLADETKAKRNLKRKLSLLDAILLIFGKIINFFVGALNFLNITTRSFPQLRVLAVGDVGELISPRLIAVAGYNTHANPDQSFGNNGQVIQPAGSDKIEVAAADYNSRYAKSVVITHKHDNDLPVLRIALPLWRGLRPAQSPTRLRSASRRTAYSAIVKTAVSQFTIVG